MPAQPKSPKAVSASRKMNPIAKSKGAVRAKSGCYTCRIRRKKCDERRIGEENGPCETCIRLKLECLGFGAKRPDWLRDTHRVAEIRDRIKAHLAAQGMIKGHAGSGSRNQVQDEILRLSEYHGPSHDMHRPISYNSSGSSSGGSPIREDSVESDHPYSSGHRHLALSLPHQMSSVRYHHPYDGYHHDQMSSRFHSPSDIAHPYEYPEMPAEMYAPETYSSNETPALRSSLSLLYHAHFTIDDFDEEYDPQMPQIVPNPTEPVPQFIIGLSVQNYVNNVVNIQYLLGDRNSLPDMIWRSINAHAPSHEAVTLLSQLYFARQNPSVPFSLLDSEDRISKLKGMLSRAQGDLSADDAMTALHIVSYYLFAGGQGRWNEFLVFACHYARKVLENPNFMYHYPTALDAATPKDQFVVKTAIWFDVLASITTRKPPQLLLYIRALFKPDNSYVGTPMTCSMMSPMGCQNTVVWALAETSDLSYWKRRGERNGDLSVRELVRRVQEIEPYLADPIRPIRPQVSPEDWSRFVASEIFRTSTKLFLKSVESGDFPHVQEIRDGVSKTLQAIRDTPKGIGGGRGGGMSDDRSQSAIVRSTVFGSYICGSLTDDYNVLRQLTNHLEQNAGHEGVGNCWDVSTTLKGLWDSRATMGPRRPVPWRKHLAQQGILLV